jgi:hypothetical protein
LIASGYNERVLPYAWLALVSGLAGYKIGVKDPEPPPQRFISDVALVNTGKVIREVKDNLRDYWTCLR